MIKFQYSADFYLWMFFCSVPSIGFIYALINKDSRPWARKAIEDSDDKPHQVDLTFTGTLIAGWIVCNALFAGLGQWLFEGRDTFAFCSSCIGLITLLWGLKHVAHKITKHEDKPR